MRNITVLLSIGIVLMLSSVGCGPGRFVPTTSATPTTTMTAHELTPAVLSTTPTQPGLITASSTLTPVSSELTPIPPTPTLTPIPQGKTIIVTSASNSGPGTLRQAILDAMPGDLITFDRQVFPPDHPTTISLENEDNPASGLRIDKDGITINASNAGVILDGGNTQGEWMNGIDINSDGNTIQGLQIVNFSGHGIDICDGSHNQIGGDRENGDGPLGQGNLLSKNARGIYLCGRNTSFNIIRGNLIGTDPTGTYALARENFWITNEWGNIEGGIWIEDGARQNIIGPENIIATNYSYGIRISGKMAVRNTILQNSIHDNGGEGIQLEDDGNNELMVPIITNFDLITGIVDGTACANCLVEIFSDDYSEGKFFEGQTTADGSGKFTFDSGAHLTGPRITALGTDAEGNTSQFSRSVGFETDLQMENDQPRYQIHTRPSGGLVDNRIGSHWSSLMLVPYLEDMLDLNLALGVKRFRTSINLLDSNNLHLLEGKSEFSIDPKYDDFITKLADNDVLVTYVLSFWDRQFQDIGGELKSPRFQTEEEVQRYLDYVKFVVQHLKDRVHYYEIWNEPSLSSFPKQWIKVDAYINLVKRAVPVIRQEDPEAKIVVGSTHSLVDRDSRNYLFSILKSDIMPMVDVIAWHPMYGISPEYDNSLRQFYYGYPNLVQEIKDSATDHGFKGEFIADELAWWPPDTSIPQDPWTGASSEIKAAKYLTRGIILNLGMDVSITQQDKGDVRRPPIVYTTVQNLCSIMAGNKPVHLPVTIQGDADHIKSYGFSLPGGENLFAVWIDGAAVDYDTGIPSTLVFPGRAGQKAIGIDVLNGFEQVLTTENDGDNLVIRGFLLKDYPIIIRLSQR